MERMLWTIDRYGWMLVACLAVALVGCIDSQASNNNPPKFTPVTEDPETKPGEKVDDPPVNPAVKNSGKAEEDPPKPEEDPEKVPPGYPYPVRVEFPELPVGADWANTKPLSKADLKGKFVLFDFWTYCCINCIHILPELKKLEHEFENELVVVGVHCAKFEAEKDSTNIRNAVIRYEIEHPVINDPEHEIWQAIGVSSWPTLVLMDPEGNAFWLDTGESAPHGVAEQIKKGIAYFKEKGLLKEGPMKFDLERDKLADTPLLFPGKVVADEAGKRLFISDSNHHRIIVTDLTGNVQTVYGSGKVGKEDGPAETASFHLPQGTVLSADGKMLYVADTENHLLRKIDLEKKEVTTIAGTGKQSQSNWPGVENITSIEDLPKRFVGPPKTTAISSPWDLWIHENTLYIAMAGPHQIWSMTLDESEIGPFAGNGREDIIDGPHLPELPTPRSVASAFAQPSGLSSDGTVLFVADSEGSSIRAVPFDPEADVTTVVGSNNEFSGRLFSFGDVDGLPGTAKLQHALGVCYVDGTIYVTDTYNNKIKTVDAKSGETKTLVGDLERGKTDDPPRFNEPAGISHAGGILYIADTNNHLIRTLEIATGKVGTLSISGLPNAPAAATKKEAPAEDSPKSAAIGPILDPSVVPATALLADGKQIDVPLSTVKAEDGKVTLHVALTLPKGWKINPIGPMAYQLEAKGEKGPVDRTKFGKKKLEKPANEFDIPLTVQSEGEDSVSVNVKYYYCEDKEGDDATCKIGSVVFAVPLKISKEGKSTTVDLKYTVE